MHVGLEGGVVDGEGRRPDDDEVGDLVRAAEALLDETVWPMTLSGSPPRNLHLRGQAAAEQRADGENGEDDERRPDADGAPRMRRARSGEALGEARPAILSCPSAPCHFVTPSRCLHGGMIAMSRRLRAPRTPRIAPPWELGGQLGEEIGAGLEHVSWHATPPSSPSRMRRRPTQGGGGLCPRRADHPGGWSGGSGPGIARGRAGRGRARRSDDARPPPAHERDGGGRRGLRPRRPPPSVTDQVSLRPSAASRLAGCSALAALALRLADGEQRRAQTHHAGDRHDDGTGDRDQTRDAEDDDADDGDQHHVVTTARLSHDAVAEGAGRRRPRRSSR